jgi:ABC-type antimicrobial peptide transport system permease subunit
MILKNLSLAIRHMMRYRAYSFLNIFGLAIGMASAMLIVLCVNDEVNTDKFHKNGKNIFIIRTQMKLTGGQTAIWPTNSPLAPAIAADVPEVKTIVRLTHQQTILFKLGEKSFFEKGYYADSSFFNMFSFKLVSGDPNNVLKNSNSIVISEKLAKKYFDNENPIGKTIRLSQEELYTVSGVFKNVSKMSSLQFDFILPFSKFYQYNKSWLNWENFALETYILTKTKTNIKLLDDKINKVLVKNNAWAKEHALLFAQPYEDMYLHDNIEASIHNPSGKILYVKIFSAVAIFIILLACMNYINLATALAIKRSKEVGVKKVFGSNRKKLIFQFTLEAIILTFIGFFLSLIILECILPYFNQFIGKDIVLNYRDFGNIGRFLLIPVITGFLAGTFPAIYISSFKPIIVLKNIFRPQKGTIHLRHVLVIFQFVITIAFIISSFVILKQIRFIQNKTLGLDKDNIVFFSQGTQIQKQRNGFKNELKKQAGIINVSYTSNNPLEVHYSTTDLNWRGKLAGSEYVFYDIAVDHDFAQTLGAEIIEGRDFSTSYPSDTNCILINQEALRIMHLESPIGEVVNYWGRHATIIGIVKDFHFSNLHVPIKQMMIMCRPNSTHLVMVKIKGNMRKEAIKNIEKVFRDFEGNVPFEAKFLDQEYEKNYDTEKYMSRFSNLFTVLAIVISCLGLFGLALFTAEQKTKEIGIRKSIGASTSQIIVLLAKDFLKWIAIAYVIACAISYFVLHGWLQNFAYRTKMSWWIFAITGIITIFIAFITVSWQSWRAASRNPVESLRYE